LQTFHRFLPTVRSKLFFLLLTVLVPVLLFEVGTLYVRFQERKAHEYQVSLEIARVMARTFDGFLKDILHQERAIGINLTMHEPLPVEQMNKLLELNKADHPAIRSFTWIGPEGRVIASTLGDSIGLDVGDRAYLREVAAGREWALSELIQSRTTGQPIFTISRGVRDKDGNLLGILIAGVNPDELAEMFAVELSREGAITLIDSRGMAVCQYPKMEWDWEARNLLKKRPAVKEALEGKEFIGTFPGFVAGEERIVAFSPAGATVWVISAGRSKDAVMAPLKSQIQQQTGVILFIMVVVITVALVISHRITAPVRRLREHAAALGRGQMERRIEIDGSVELRDLASSFDRMAHEIGSREQALRESEEKFRGLAEASADYIMRYDRDCRHVYINPAGARVMGRPGEEFIGKTCRDLGFGKELCDVWEEKINQVFESGEPQQWDFEFVGAEGKVYLDWRVVPEFKSGKVESALGVSRDITQRVQAVEALRESEERFRQMFENAADGLILHDRDWIIDVNQQYCRNLGYTRDEVLRMSLADIEVGLGRESLSQLWEREADNVPTHSGMQRRKDGSTFPVEVRVADVSYRGRRLRLAVVRDVSERERAEKALRQSEQEKAAILGGLRDVIVEYVDPETRIIWASPAMARASGLSTEELAGRYCYEVIQGLPAPCDGCTVLKAVQTGEFQEGEIETRDGRVWMVGSNPIKDDSGKVTSVVHVAVNITERKRAEEALRTSEEKYRMIFEHSPLGIFHFDNDGIVTACNENALRIFGSSKEKLLGFNLAASLQDEAASVAIATCLSGKIGHYEGCYPLRMGTKSTPIKVDYGPIFSDDGSVLGGIALVEDISERLRAQEALQESERRLRFLSSRLLTAQEKERKKIAGELHDSVGSSLCAIKMSLQNAQKQIEEGIATPASLEIPTAWIGHAIDEARKIIMDLRPSMLDDLGIIATIRWFCGQFRMTHAKICVEEEVRVEENEVPGSLKIVIFRVVQEALHNIAKYSEAELVNLFLGKTKGKIELTIEDNGVGFDLQSTLSSENEKRGLGLASMKERTELSGGIFTIESAREVGTTIRACWPL
jgi:PAS domain S-box-containing protein